MAKLLLREGICTNNFASFKHCLNIQQSGAENISKPACALDCWRSLEGCCSIQLSYGQMIETTQHVLGCWEMVDWREVSPRPSLILSGPQGGGVESVRFFTSPTT